MAIIIDVLGGNIGLTSCTVVKSDHPGGYCSLNTEDGMNARATCVTSDIKSLLGTILC